MFKSAVLAAVAVVGIGSAAGAAVVPAPFGTFSVEMKMTDAFGYCYSCSPDSSVAVEPYGGMTVGDIVRGTLTVADNGYKQNILIDLFWSGGILADNLPLTLIDTGSYWNTYTQEITFFKSDGPFSGLLRAVSFRGEDIEQYYDIQFAELAPVPLPESAALLPLGIGALAFMRKRRKRVS